MKEKLFGLVIPRDDYFQVPGGDRVMVEEIKSSVNNLGTSLTVTLPSQLNEICQLPDFLYITQIYQERNLLEAINWGAKQNIPIFISPLFEEFIPWWYRQAVQAPGIWKRLNRIVGHSIGEKIYCRWRFLTRFRLPGWSTTRKMLQSVYLLPNSNYELFHLIDWFGLNEPLSKIVPLGVHSDFWGKKS